MFHLKTKTIHPFTTSIIPLTSSIHPSSFSITPDHIDEPNMLQLSRKNMIKGTLPSKEAILVLVDSGATSSLICAKTVQASRYLSQLPKRKAPSLKFTVGNGQHIWTKDAMDIPISIGGQPFIIEVRTVDTLGGIGIVLGSESLAKLDARLNFRKHQLHFKGTSINLNVCKDMTIQPGNTNIIQITGKLPNFLKNATAFIKSSKFATNYSFPRMLVKFDRGIANVVVCNPTRSPVTLNKNKAFATLAFSDLTNVYTPVNQRELLNMLQPALKNKDGESAETPNTPYEDGEKKESAAKQQPTRRQIKEMKRKKYPHLEEDDARLTMYDSEIIDRDIKFEDCVLHASEKQKLTSLINAYKDAFSLHSEIGDTGITVDFDLNDTNPFYIRPFTVAQAEKPLIDKELQKLVKMGVLTPGHSQYSSPVMLIRKKDTDAKRLVTDFRFLNQRIIKRNLPFPLLRDALQTIGHAQPTVISVLDLKEAYHSLSLTPKASKYCGITSYHGGESFLYRKLPMGLALSPAEFQTHINSIIAKAKAKSFCIGIMDDLIVFSRSKAEHFQHIETVLTAIQSNGLKISPAKAKLFRNKVTYMGHKLLIKNGGPCITPLRQRTEAIIKMPIPDTKRKLKGFIGKVSYLSMYLPKLQKLLRPLHAIAAKKAQFVWDHTTQEAYDTIIQLLVKPPILAMPNSTGLFRLYCDTSKIGVGAALYQIQRGEERLLGYFSKALPRAAANYSITELEFTGLYISVHAFRYLLKSVNFEVYTDHSAIPQIMRAKTEPATARLKRLIEKISSYSMKIGYRKGSTMVVADFLSRNPQLSNEDLDIAFVVTRSQARREAEEPTMPTTPAPPAESSEKKKTTTPEDPIATSNPRPRGRPRTKDNQKRTHRAQLSKSVAPHQVNKDPIQLQQRSKSMATSAARPRQQYANATTNKEGPKSP